MNWYDVIGGDENRVPNFFMATEYDISGSSSIEPQIGQIIPDWNPESRLWSDAPEWDGEPDDILANSIGWPIFSQRLRSALKQADIGARDIQYLPIHVARSTGQELPGFAVANIITRIPALDRDNSFMLSVDDDEIDPLTGMPSVSSIGKAALKSDLLRGHDVIRLLEFFPSVFVSERFVKIFNENKFTGTTFRRSPTF
jgi:hypothetical protein